MLETLRKHWLYVVAFLLGFFIRLVPELFSLSYPAGADIPFYIFELRLMESGFDLSMLYFGNPLPYLVLLALRGLSGVDWFVLFKIFLPVLNGVVVCSFLYFLRNGLALDWSKKDYVLCVLLLVFSASGVIMSNGIVKHQIAMVFFFFFMVAYKRQNVGRGILFAGLVGLSHLIVPVFLCLFLFVDGVFGFWKFRTLRWGSLWVVLLLVGVVFGVTFVLPSLQSVDPIGEVAGHLGAFFNDGGFGVRYNSVPIVERVFNHFVWYYSVWVGFVVAGLLKFRDRVVNGLLFSLVPLSVVALGTVWARFQWLLVYPFSVVVVGGTKSLRGLTLLFLGFVLVSGCLLSIDGDWSMARSSLPFDEIPVIKQSFDDFGSLVSDDSLLVSSSWSYAWVNLWCLDNGISPTVMDERRLSFGLNDVGLSVCRGGLKGHDFFDYRVSSVCFDVGSFDCVLVFDDGHFTDKGTFDGYWQFFHEESRVGNVIVYRYGV